MDHSSKELNLGRAGEHIAIADLILKGEKAFLTDQGMNYDLVVDRQGKLLRLQVKTTQKPRLIANHTNPIYFFHVRRAGKESKRQYQVGEFEGFALVALDIKEVFYLPFDKEISASICIRDKKISYDGRGTRGKEMYYQDLTWEQFLIHNHEK